MRYGHDSGDKVVAQPNTLTTATLLRQPRRIILVEMFYLVIFSNRNLSTAWHSWVWLKFYTSLMGSSIQIYDHCSEVFLHLESKIGTGRSCQIDKKDPKSREKMSDRFVPGVTGGSALGVPGDFLEFSKPRPSILPSGLGVQNPCPWEISQSSGMYFPIHPSSGQCTDTITTSHYYSSYEFWTIVNVFCLKISIHIASSSVS